jgi:UDP-N-acetylglucosamine--N-acetylmuramyl-(pentapeptide) pyrophosphoryl-undecaprenol N-acetylglucosamine transferase
MSATRPGSFRFVIACGGTGGHLFPGLAVARELVARGCEVRLLVSPKEVDREAAKTAGPIPVSVLPAVGLERGRRWAFLRGFIKSYLAAQSLYRAAPPAAALAMGGFTSAPPLLAARRQGARTFLHESNTIPGRANRWLARWVDEAFAGFPETAERLRCRRVTVTGTPVRAEFQAQSAAACRAALGLNPARPTLLIMGGSQGASAINHLVTKFLPLLAGPARQWQWLHLTGAADFPLVKRAYAEAGLAAVVVPFLERMDQALGAATAAVSRAGGSSLAELAAMRVPALLIPYPAAADDHQFHNARAFAAGGAARLLPQATLTPEILLRALEELVEQTSVREQMQQALARRHCPHAADQIAAQMLARLTGGAASELAPGQAPAVSAPPADRRPGANPKPEMQVGGAA